MLTNFTHSRLQMNSPVTQREIITSAGIEWNKSRHASKIPSKSCKDIIGVMGDKHISDNMLLYSTDNF